jgi:hypothetical protein
MATIATIDGVPRRSSLGFAEGENCKCISNSRTKRMYKLCKVPVDPSRTRTGKNRTQHKIVGLCK